MILEVQHTLRLLDGSDVRGAYVSTSIVEEEYAEMSDEDLETLLPALPDRMRFQDLSLFGVDFTRLLALRDWNLHGDPLDLRRAGFNDAIWTEDIPHEESMEVVLPDEWWELSYPVSNRYTYRCYDCLRPLYLFQLVSYDKSWPRGYCTQHLLQRNVVQPGWSAAKKEKKKLTFDQYQTQWNEAQLQSWLGLLRRAWAQEREEGSARYVKWRDQQIRLMRMASSREND